jgi:ElaB/YqjD/DUF883 family membrane-anchored ribosome-binding protein
MIAKPLEASKQSYNRTITLMRNMTMFSSKIQDIKKNTQEVADDIADKAKIVVDDTREAAGKVSDRVSKEGAEIKTEIEVLLGRLYDLLKPEEVRDIRQRVRENLDSLSERITAWAGAREDEIATVVHDGRRSTRKVVYQSPFISLAIAAGTGALIAYWLTRRPATQTERK